MSDQISDPIRKCSIILKNAKSDTEKFAALFMVTKLIKGKDCNEAGKRLLFDAIGLDFVRRLLTSKDIPDASAYQSVALSILSCFCEDEQLATHKDMLDSIPVFLSIVSTCDDEEYDDNLIVINEAYHCLQSIAAHEKGRQALRELDVVRKMAQIADILVNEYGFQRDLATEVSTTFLTSYRRCPDNPDIPLAQWRTQLWQDALPSGRKHLAAQLYPRWVEYRTRYFAPSAEILSMLQTLRLQYLLGIVTNGPSASQWEKIDRLALGRYFDCILVSSDLPWAKPDRNMFYAACHYLRVQPEECAMIGDKLETDIQGGLESKLAATIWLPLPIELRLMHDKSLADLDHQIQPDYIVENVLDLPAVLPLTTSFCQQRCRPLVERRGSNSYTPKTTRNREASYNQFLPDVPDLYSSSSNSCDSSGTLESH